VKQIARNRTWILTIGITALMGLGIVWGAYTLTFLQPFAEELNPLEPLDPADYRVDLVDFLQPLDEGIIEVALNENELIEQWRDGLWEARSENVPGKDLTPTVDFFITPSSTKPPTETQIITSPTLASSPTQVIPPSSTPFPDTPTLLPTETSTMTPLPTLVPTNTPVPTSPPQPTKPPNPTIIVKPPTITPTPVINQSNTPKFGS
jgi:hypothetical protein